MSEYKGMAKTIANRKYSFNPIQDPITKMTPKSKMVTKISLPQTPRKYHNIIALRSLNVNNINNFTPSKSNTASKILIISDQMTVKPQTLAFNHCSSDEEEDTINEYSEDEFNTASIFDQDYDELLMNSGNRTISPFSDVETNDFEKNPNFEIPFLDDNSSLFNVSLELHRIINSQSLESNLDEMHIHTPCHHMRMPTKSILKIPTSLNLLVESSRGSLEDATIFATEINAHINSENNRLPIITNEMQKITIPVTTSTKERYSMLKKKYLSEEDWDESFLSDFENDCDSSTVDATETAIIKGFKFESSISKKLQQEGYFKTKILRWSPCT